MNGGARMRRDVEFQSGGVTVRGDLYLPDDAAGPVPIVVMAGGWCYVKELVQPHYADGGDGVGSDTVMAALEAHPDVALELLAASTGQSVEWLGALPERDGANLLMLCVVVHVPFFVARLERAYQSRAQLDLLNAARALAKSSPASSATDMTKPH